jgi:ABC-type long-subunit fatty acid transport system fused permease/ATPase subunit
VAIKRIHRRSPHRIDGGTVAIDKVVDYRSPTTVAEPSPRRIANVRRLSISAAVFAVIGFSTFIFVQAHLNDFGFLLLFPALIAALIGLALGLGAWLANPFRRTRNGDGYLRIVKLIILALLLSAVVLVVGSFQIVFHRPATDF